MLLVPSTIQIWYHTCIYFTLIRSRTSCALLLSRRLAGAPIHAAWPQHEGSDYDEAASNRRGSLARAFLESSYLPFASFLLREVGPTWLPIWDSGPASPASPAATRSDSGNDSGNGPVATALLPSAGTADATIAAGDHGSVDTATGGATVAVNSRESTSAAAGGRSARAVFEAFFRPPAVPASLALLALCESLGKQTPESSTGWRPPRLSPRSSSGVGASWEAAAAEAGGGRGRGVDARTIQHVCRLLEPYLRESPLVSPAGDSGGGSGGSLVMTRRSASRSDRAEDNATPAGTSRWDAQTVHASLEQQQPQPQRHSLDMNSAMDGTISASLLVQAVMELVCSQTPLKCGARDDATRADEDREHKRPVNQPPLVGGDAAESLASALCLAPRRVANSLGPLASPAFNSELFYPTVCRAVVHGILCCLETKIPSAGGPIALRRRALAGEEPGALFMNEDDAKRQHKVDTAARSSGTASTAGRGVSGSTPPVRSRSDGAVGDAVAGDVWRAFSGRLLAAGRASDLADAWLRAMARRGERGERRLPVTVVPTVMIGSGTAAASTTSRKGSYHSNSGGQDNSVGELIADGGGNKDSTAGDVATAWETWADSTGPQTHAWMMATLPASRRKPFMEALLRALWPRDLGRPSQQRPGQRQSCNWPPGFRSAACRALIGRPLVAVRSLANYIEHDGAAVAVASNIDDLALARVGEDGSTDISVGLVEGLLLQRPLPPPAAGAIADTLAWCDRWRLKEATRAAGEGGSGGVASGGAGGLLMRALKRVAAVWAEPSFLNRSPPRQQEFYTQFLLSSLRR